MNRQKIIDSVNSHGEIHIVVEEHESVVNDADEDYIGLRLGTNYNYGTDCIEIDTGSVIHYIPYDSIVYMQKPSNFPD